MFSDARSLDWIKIREGVLARDNYQCVECGIGAALALRTCITFCRDPLEEGTSLQT